MAKDFYINDAKGPGKGKKILVSLLVVFLIAGLAAGAGIWYREYKSARTLDDFKDALESSDYDLARDLYHQTQERALSPGIFDFNQTRDIETVSQMEQQMDSLLQQIINKIQNLESVSEQELEFAEGMGELSAVRLAAFLRGAAGDFLRGSISREELDHAFNLLGELENITGAVSGLSASFDRMDELRPEVSQAQKLLANEQYWQAYELYLKLLDEDNLTSFIYDQIWQMRQEAEELMYDPLLERASGYIEGGRYISAHGELVRLQTIFPDDKSIAENLKLAAGFVPPELELYTGVLEFVSIRPLIVNPEKAFDGDSYAATADEAMLTTVEFSRILQQLHENNYILVDSDVLYTEDGRFAPLYLPPGKKPLVLVIEGLNYYASRRQTGNSWDLALDDEGHVSAIYPDDSGGMTSDRNGEAIGILDLYVRENPDFSLNGARGTISLTGYECIFGKVTDVDQMDDRNWALENNNMAPIELSADDIAQNRRETGEIIERLKETGWCFASSTYGYIDARSHEMERIVEDTEKWLEQVGSLTGPVAMLNYPHGSFIPGSDARAEYLREKGFILFAGQGPSAYNFSGDEYVYVDKTPLNGYSLRNSRQFSLERFFDASTVYDSENRIG